MAGRATRKPKTPTSAAREETPAPSSFDGDDAVPSSPPEASPPEPPAGPLLEQAITRLQALYEEMSRTNPNVRSILPYTKVRWQEAVGQALLELRGGQG